MRAMGSTVLAVSLALGLAAGCRSPLDVDVTTERDAHGMSTPGGEALSASGRILAGGHFRRQVVDAVDASGNTFQASFVANFRVYDDGHARGSFTLFSGRTMTVYRITGGRVICEARTPAVVLSGTVHGPGAGRVDAFEAALTPVDDPDNPECIIWDIKDGCSHEAQGKYDVVTNACAGS